MFSSLQFLVSQISCWRAGSGDGSVVRLNARLVIERPRVRIPAGAVGEFASPALACCADSYFGIRSTPVYRCSGRLQLNTHTPYVCSFAWSDMVHGCMVYTERAETTAVLCGTSHASAVSTPLRWIFKKRAIKKLVTHASAVSLLESEQRRTELYRSDQRKSDIVSLCHSHNARLLFVAKIVVDQRRSS